MRNSQAYSALSLESKLEPHTAVMRVWPLGKWLLLLALMSTLSLSSGCSALGEALGGAGTRTAEALRQQVEQLATKLEEKVKTTVVAAVETAKTSTEDYLRGIIETGQAGLKSLVESGKDAAKEGLAGLGSAVKDSVAGLLGSRQSVDAALMDALEELLDKDKITPADVEAAIAKRVSVLDRATPVGEDKDYWRDLIMAIVGSGAVAGVLGLRQTSKAHESGKEYARRQLMQMLAAARNGPGTPSTEPPATT